ncbi:MAG: transglycosylase SLT domain-containing protein [Gammaproteobacteria bacterium]|nr:transglycosylase SLT domain-containing protein [Gammaproteobacteria bacterium]
MKKNNQLMLLSGGFMLIAAAILDDETRVELQKVLGLPEDFGADLFAPVNAGQRFAETRSTSNQTTGQFQSQTEAIKFPNNRKLTTTEVLRLADHVIEKYGIYSTSAQDLTVFAYVESSFRPWVQRDEGFDKSTGLMQTLLGTATDMYKKGYKALGKPTEQSLKDPIVSMYFGAAYLQWLKTNYAQWGYDYGNYEDFFIRSYNGGAGWRKTPNGAKNTEQYLKKWKSAKARLDLPNAIFMGV